MCDVNYRLKTFLNRLLNRLSAHCAQVGNSKSVKFADSDTKVQSLTKNGYRNIYSDGGGRTPMTWLPAWGS